MPLWIALTIGAAFLQNFRSALQKRLAGEISTTAATYIRFLYGVPVAAVYFTTLMVLTGAELPQMHRLFLLYAGMGGLAQIFGTLLLVGLFAYRNFAVGNTFSKTETVQAALFGIILLGDYLSGIAFLAILVSLAGILTLSVTQSHLTLATFWRSLGDKATLMGVGSGACFGISAVSYRAASLSLEHPNFLVAAGYTLVAILTFQTIIMTIWLAARQRGELLASLRSWRVGSLVGLTGALASAGWFTAMTLQNAAYVKALGQIELVFSYIASRFFFREKTSGIELIGILLVVGGILMLVFAR